MVGCFRNSRAIYVAAAKLGIQTRGLKDYELDAPLIKALKDKTDNQIRELVQLAFRGKSCAPKDFVASFDELVAYLRKLREKNNPEPAEPFER